jgi:hypothetical protein
VKEAVETAGGALAEVDALDEDRTKAPQGGVANNPKAGCAAADDKDIAFMGDDY